MPNEEDVRLKVDNVKSKKVDGTLYMMGERMAWMGNSKKVITVSFNYCDIKYHRSSLDDTSKVRLQIVCYNEMMSTFHFCNPAGVEAQKKDRDAVSELLKDILPKFRTIIDQALEMKIKILHQNKNVLQLYQDLVVNGLVNADDFWDKYVDFKKLSESIKKQNTGVSGSFFTNIPKESGENGSTTYKLNTDTITSIFRTYPAVQEKYRQSVPTGLMSETDFWRTFCQSHYFNMHPMQTTASQDLFSDCVQRDDKAFATEAERASQKVIAVIAPEDDEIKKIGYGVDETAGEIAKKNDMNKSLIKRFNFHSTMILKSTLGVESNANSTASTQADPEDEENVTKKFKPNDDLEELKTETPPEMQPMKLVNADRYLRAPTIDRLQKNNLQQQTTNLDQLKREMSQWTMKTSLSLNSILAHKIVGHLTPGGALMHTTTPQTLSQIVPQSIQDEMQTIYTTLSELLRHFWSSFPPSSPQVEDKIHRVHETIKRFREKQVATFRDKVSTDSLTDFHLADHIDDLIDTAMKKYNLWCKTLAPTGRT